MSSKRSSIDAVLASPGGEKSRLSEVLFNLASVGRLSRLAEISSRPLRLKDLSASINASAQETSRHLARLQESGLVKKDASGVFQLTSVGRTYAEEGDRNDPSFPCYLRTIVSRDHESDGKHIDLLTNWFSPPHKRTRNPSPD